MTKEEKLAEEYICNGKCPDDISKSYEHCSACTRLNDFLAGLKAAKPRWHKVADGDLPPDLTHVLNEKGNKVMYDVHEHTWQEYSDYYEDYVEADTPVAWCEVPKFEEE